MREGINDTTAVGRAGGYKSTSFTEVLQLGTVIARGLEFFTPGKPTVPLASVPVGLTCSRELLQASWTGRSFRYRWDDRAVDVHLRTTTPGPMFTTFGRQLDLRFAFGNAPDVIEGLETGRRHSAPEPHDLGRVLLLTGPDHPSLIVASQPIATVEVISHEHLTLHFEADGANVMWVALLPGAEPPTADTLDLWLRLVAAPPLCCNESFECAGHTVRVRQQFTDLDGHPSDLAPLPPMAALLGAEGGLQQLPTGTVLTKTLLGPYAVVEGDHFDWTIDTAWMRSHLSGARQLAGELAQNLSPIPDELVYAGDPSWEPGTPMDQCLSLRVWAPLGEVAPPDLWAALKPQLTPPTPDEFRRSLMTVCEPITGRRWAKDAALFGYRGDISYDSDWYNGLTVAGIWRGVGCADADIAAACRSLALQVRPERDLMLNYMWLFYDWALCCAWTDPRGETWNLDCSHNGLEGVLAEARLRELEGDAEGAELATYLAAKLSVAFMAAFPLADWSRSVGFTYTDGGDPHLGVDDVREWRGAYVSGPRRRAPYALTCHFFEYWQLLAKHGPVDRLREIVAVWERDHPQRYDDWEVFYTGGKRSATTSMHQEARTQAAVMYHLAPDVGLRLWVLGQDGGEIEALFKTPLNLAEQLWCRSGALFEPPDDH